VPAAVAAGLLPERAGQPVKVSAHIYLADLIDLDLDSKLQQDGPTGVRGQWAAARAAASVGGSDVRRLAGRRRRGGVRCVRRVAVHRLWCWGP